MLFRSIGEYFLELEILLEKLSTNSPEDAFGSGSFEDIRKVYILMAKAVHPDKHMKNKKDRELAELCSKKLNTLWTEAKVRIKQGIYGSTIVVTPKVTEPTTISTKQAIYRITSRIYSGGTCGVFKAIRIDNKTNTSKEVLLKVPHSSKDNDLLNNEFKVVNSINSKIKESTDNEEALKRLSLLVPSLIEKIKIEKKHINVYEYSEDCYDLVQIHNSYGEIVKPEVAVFIFNRILNCLMVAHNSGWVHGCIRPNHMIIHKPTHCGCLIDWSCSKQITESKKLPYIDSKWKDFIAPEVLASKIPSIKGDIYSAACCACYLFGDGKDLFSVNIYDQIGKILNLCLQPNIKKRPTSAEEVFDLFGNAVYEVYGKPKFVELAV